MSEIKTDKLTGVSTAGSILVTGEGNSTTTNLQQGLAKAWVTYTDVSWTIGDSLNCSSATDHTTADFSTNFTNNFGSNNIVSAGTSTYGAYFSYYESSGNSHTTSSVRYYGLTTAGSATDPNYSYGSSSGWNYQGDLA
tara:strand:+ start:2808 stop:3221 length:414 start_codon:yes stop_codon:yes gene_type:complete